jgi:hypothetical protein
LGARTPPGLNARSRAERDSPARTARRQQPVGALSFADSAVATIGSGKWLLRRLRAWGPELAAALVDSFRRSLVEDDSTPLLDVAAVLLDERGGRAQAGYVRIASA